MRAYFFGNMYLSSIQQGIQAGHVVTEMFIDYRESDSHEPYSEILYNWAHDHKTMILLNGGYGENLHDLVDFFDQDDNSYPFAFFKESEGALDNAITSVGIILPEKIYEGVKAIKQVMRLPRTADERVNFLKNNELSVVFADGSEFNVTYTEWEVDLMQRLNKFRLAQ